MKKTLVYVKKRINGVEKELIATEDDLISLICSTES